MSNTTVSARVWEQNLEFWQRAWNNVRVPYTRLPELSYLARIPQSLAPGKSSRVLDLGCGSGWLSVFLARSGFRMVGVDIAFHAVNLAKKWAEDEGLEIDFKTQDITELTFPSGYFGAAVANSIFEHLSFDLSEKTVESLNILLIPGGIFLACFDRVGTGPGDYYKLEDGTHVYTDRARQGMMLRSYSNAEIERLFSRWSIDELSEMESGTRFLIARKRLENDEQGKTN